MHARKQGHGSWLLVVNDYQWIGNPRLGAFSVYVDGRLAGIAPLGEDLNVQVDPGRHTVRVRGWWYLSPRTQVDVKPGETARFSADIPQGKPFWRRMGRAIFDPFHSLSLKRVGSA